MTLIDRSKGQSNDCLRPEAVSRTKFCADALLVLTSGRKWLVELVVVIEPGTGRQKMGVTSGERWHFALVHPEERSALALWRLNQTVLNRPDIKRESFFLGGGAENHPKR